MPLPVDLPTGKQPGWEKDLSDADYKPTSVLESCVVLQSLRQSRDQWMYSVFPKFSGRVRGKLDTAHTPPPHTIQSRGRCQIEIGPHIFSETSFFEVQYLPPAPAAPSFIQSSWQSPYNAYAPYGHQSAPAASQASVVQHTTSPLLSSLTSVTTITPALINQVNAAAASNPTLANLLQLAAAGKASAEQLKTLGLLIQSLAVPESSEALSSAANLMKSSSAQPYPPVAANTPVKEFDLVLQYYETSSDRWIIPRGPVICEKVADARTPAYYDIVLTMALGLPKPPQSSAEADADKPNSQVVSIRLKRPPPTLWETIWRWVGGEEKLKENRTILDDLKKQPNRVYLAHQLPQNALLTQLQNAAAPHYVMKSIKPGPVVVPRPKRKPVQRKPTQPTPAQPTPEASGSAAASSSTSAPVPANPSPAPGSSNATAPEAKRRKITKQNAIEIRCVSCQQTDVPLILGGRFCRPCVDSGKATAVYVPYRPQQYGYQIQQYAAPAAPGPAAPGPGQGGSSLQPSGPPPPR